MKTLIKVVPLVLAAAITSQTTQAETSQPEATHDPKQAIAVVSSGIIGGLLAGPVGFFAAAIGAGLLVDAESNREEELQSAASEEVSEPIKPPLTLAIDLPAAEPVLESIELPDSEVSVSELAVESEELELVKTPVNADSNQTMDEIAEDKPQIKMDDLATKLFFGSSQYTMNESMKRQILSLSKALEQFPSALIQVDGYTDPRGDSTFNLDLSQRRADRVAKALVEQGIDRARIVVRSHGETKSSSSDYDYSAHQKERSVEISLSPMLSEQSLPSEGIPVAKIK